MSAADYLVFECASCKKRVFADRSRQGQKGTCPLCGKETPIGGSPSDKRRNRRVPLQNARLGYETRATLGRPVDLVALDDVSETGCGFSVKGERDARRLNGFSPPAELKVGEPITLTLQIPELFRTRLVKAVVRRLAPIKTQKELFRVGAEFVSLTDEIRADLRKLIDKK